jgi:hypothetical protein
MAMFLVTLTDQTADIVEGADAYQQEGPLTTFFAFGSHRAVIDSWSVRLASFRTSDIVAIRRTAGVTPSHDVAEVPISAAGTVLAGDAVLASA